VSKKGREKDARLGDDAPADGALKAAPTGPFNNPFAAALKDLASAAPVSAKTAEPAATKRVPGPARAVVRMERKGHGGKEVTVVEQLGLPERDLERWLKALKGSLGCGGTVNGTSLILQGDHRERLRELLVERGVKKVTLG
jgi:translation initiation factor 1